MRRTISSSCRGPGRSGRRRGGAARRCPSSGRCRACAPTCRPPTSTGCSASTPWTPAPPSSKAPGTRSRSSHDVALTAAALVRGGERAAFALCRPPGHHAGVALRRRLLLRQQRGGGGGVAAAERRGAGQRARRRLPPRQRHPADLLRARRRAGGEHPRRSHCGVSLFPRPRRRARRGRGRGVQPQPAAAARDRTSPAWSAALETGCRAVADFAPDALVVSLGVDTFKGDPISQFRLDTPGLSADRRARSGRSGCRRSS